VAGSMFPRSDTARQWLPTRPDRRRLRRSPAAFAMSPDQPMIIIETDEQMAYVVNDLAQKIATAVFKHKRNLLLQIRDEVIEYRLACGEDEETARRDGFNFACRLMGRVDEIEVQRRADLDAAVADELARGGDGSTKPMGSA
jgi:hypothetical protein